MNFRVGDLVKLIDVSPSDPLFLGNTYVVMDCDSGLVLLAVAPKNWWVTQDQIKLVES